MQSSSATNWRVDDAGDGVRAGVWEVTPGAYRAIKGTTWEFCSILSGVSEITEDGKEPVVMRAGDAFVMKPGFTGVWRCIETTRKVWVVRESASMTFLFKSEARAARCGARASRGSFRILSSGSGRMWAIR
jgi:uncharacterized cupin superfamily protein